MTDFWKQKKVLVIGGTGFIGSHIVEKLVTLGAKVSILDKLQSGIVKNISNLDGKESRYPPSLLNNTTLFEIGRESYFEFESYGFGYFSKTDSLKDAVKENNLSKDIIIDLYYDSKTGRVADITQKVLLEI